MVWDSVGVILYICFVTLIPDSRTSEALSENNSEALSENNIEALSENNSKNS